MVEDNEIKAEVSPFAIREGEIKTFDGKDGYVSINQIIQKIFLTLLIYFLHLQMMCLLLQYSILF